MLGIWYIAQLTRKQKQHPRLHSSEKLIKIND